MAKRTFMTQGLNFAATSAGTALASSAYMGLHSSTATQQTDILEILISGMATASTIAAFQFSGVTAGASQITALAAPNHDFFNNSAGTSLSSTTTGFVAATTNPSGTTVVGALVLNLGLNAFGGIIRWNAAPTQQVTMFGGGSNQMILYNGTQGGGASASANAHFIYEPY